MTTVTAQNLSGVRKTYEDEGYVVVRDVLDRVDRALYEAKKAGKNRVVATPPTPL